MTHVQAKQRRTGMGPYLRAGETTLQVAQRFGVSKGTVQIAVRELRIKRRRGPVRKEKPLKLPAPKCVRFAGVDWDKQNCVIASELGCTQENVRQARLRLGKPKSRNNGKSRRVAATKPQFKSLPKSILTKEDLKLNCTVTERGCWEWARTRSPQSGYGRIGTTYAHRFAYELAIGEIPTGLQVIHSCDNPPCVNPDHLFIGTAQDNCDDSVAKGRRKGAWRFDWEIIRAVRAAAESSNNFYEIGKCFGMSGITAERIAKRKTYKHVA
jgi:hypothetical protein